MGWHEGYGSWNSNNASINTATTGTVTIPSEAKGYKVVKIAGAAFYGCSSITKVTIPNTVEEIDWFAFSFTSAMTSLNIPASVTTISNRALAHPNGRTTLTVDAANPIYKSENNGIIEKATNTLVKGAGNMFIPATVTAIAWNRTGDYDPDYDPTGISTVNTSEKHVTTIYSLDGRRLAQPAKGVSVIRYSNGDTRKVLTK